MRKLLFLIIILAHTSASAQTPTKLNSSEIHQAIKKLNFIGSVLYVAAHPDDENTSLISYFSNHVHARTGYLSLTRGNGGQNLIGPQLKEQLGIIRTQELLAARKIDGGNQLFTRAIDFGYTKTPGEALEFWNENEVLGDVVWAIREFRPDIIINRFNHRTSGDTHGQHTASALLTMEAFEQAEDPSAFPKQLELTETFEPKRLFFNTSPWFFESEEAFREATKSGFLKFDTGVYFPSQGLSNPEIAALSRSQHQSQGFGSTGSRGSQIEYLEIIKGDLPPYSSSPFGGIDTSWNRLKGGKEIGKILQLVEENYNFQTPSASVPQLVKAYSLIQQLEDEHWKKIKTEEIKNIITASTGLFLEATAQQSSATPSEEITVNLEAINRSNEKVQLLSVKVLSAESSTEPLVNLENNKGWKETISFEIPKTLKYSSPYWLEEAGTIGKYKVNNQELIGLPENPASINVRYTVEINEVKIPFDKAVVYKYNDPVEGEVYQPLEIIPPVSINIKDKILIFSNNESKNVPVTVRAGKDSITGEIRLKTENGWKVSPEFANFSINKKGASSVINFIITPPKNQSESKLEPIVDLNGESYRDQIIPIDYKHIPRQILVTPATSKLVKLDIKKKGESIGYIEGAGDVVPESMQQIGYKVTRLNPLIITESSLASFDAVILGIRAYNTVEDLKFKQATLLKYVENGGTLIVQYNTSRGLLINSIAPYKLQLSRDRVTEEDADVTFLAPQHAVLNTPNNITTKDFDNWVQERGLYFADEWAPEFTPVLSMHDKNEEPKSGSLLVAPYGKGYFVYTGLSFFRQFPEGVPGAFRLFANLVSLGKQ